MSYIAYHCCSMDKLESVLKSKVLWLTNLTKSNDTEEVDRTYKNLWNRTKAIIPLYATGIDPEVVNLTIETVDTQLPLQALLTDPFGCCFCEDADLKHQWDEYGDYGKGVSIGFDLEWFGIKRQMPTVTSIIDNAIGYEKVMYDELHTEEAFAKICCEAMREYGMNAWILGILSTFRHYAGFIKNPTFKGEEEIRIVYYPSDSQIVKFPGLSGRISTPIEHFSLSWYNEADKSSALKSIMIGYQSTTTEQEIKDKLKKYGIESDVTITHSQCTYRKR